MTKIEPKTAAGQALSTRLTEVPEHLCELSQDDKSLDLLKQFVVPPRIKIVQPSSRPPFIERFKAGDLVALPYMQLMASFIDGKQHAFVFTPLMMFPEWTCINPIETQGQLKMVRERTFDTKSVIAQKARDPKVRKNFEPCPETPEKNGKKLFLQYLENLNYIILIHGASEFANMPIAITFAAGNYQAGTTFNGLISQRRAPLWGCNFQAVIRRRQNELGHWFGVDCENPSAEANTPPFVMDRDESLKLQGLHQEFLALYEQKLVQIDYEGEIDDQPSLKDAKDM